MIPLLFYAILVAGASCGIVPRQDQGVVDLSQFVRNTTEGKSQVKRIARLFANNDLPSAELHNVTNLPTSIDHTDIMCFLMLPNCVDFKDFGRVDLSLRGIMIPGSVKTSIAIHPNVDEETTNGGERESKIFLTSSTAKIDVNRIGWTTESAVEDTSIFSGATSFSGVMYSAHVVATFMGSKRWAKGANEENSSQNEIREERTREMTCPPKRHCSAHTWTYTRTIAGRCYVLPVVDNKSWVAQTNWTLTDKCYKFHRVYATNSNDDWQRGHSNVSLAGIYNFNEDIAAVADTFVELSREYHGFDRRMHDVWMHRPEAVKKYKEEYRCSFTYALRNPDGTPYRTHVILTEPLEQPDDSESPSNASRTLRAVGMNPKNPDICNLENGWKYSRKDGGNWFKAGAGEWEEKPDWPMPEGLKDKCAAVAALPLKDITARSQTVSEPNQAQVMIDDDEINDFIDLASKTGYNGFAEP